MIEINSTGKVGRWVDSLVEGAKDFNIESFAPSPYRLSKTAVPVRESNRTPGLPQVGSIARPYSRKLRRIPERDVLLVKQHRLMTNKYDSPPLKPPGSYLVPVRKPHGHNIRYVCLA